MLKDLFKNPQDLVLLGAAQAAQHDFNYITISGDGLELRVGCGNSTPAEVWRGLSTVLINNINNIYSWAILDTLAAQEEEIQWLIDNYPESYWDGSNWKASPLGCNEDGSLSEFAFRLGIFVDLNREFESDEYITDGEEIEA